MVYTATDLRKDIYRILDHILSTGEAVVIERKGHRLRISPIVETPATLRIRPLEGLIAGDPADLEHVDWSGEWKP